MPLSEPLVGLPRSVRAQADPPPRPDAADLFAAVVQLWAGQEPAREFEVVGESMAPILDGIQRIRARMGERNPRFGDIVLFYRGGNLIAHRVVGRSGGLLLTRGDAAKGFDAPVAPADLLGVATHLMWRERVVDLEGFGSGLLRRLLGLLSRLAGSLRLSPAGPAPGTSLPGRARDRTLGPVYRGCLRVGFRAFAAISRNARRLDQLLPRRENRLLLTALRPAASPTDQQRAALAALPERSWMRIGRRAIRLGGGPLLLDGLRRAGIEAAIPAPLRADLERAYYAQALYNTVALRELARLVSEMNAEGVVPVVLKGAALAGRLYANIGLRTLSDLDVLVRAEEVPAADRALRRAGYRQPGGASAAEEYEGHHHLAPYMPPRGHPRVELHTGLLHPRQGVRLDLEGMRRRAVATGFGDGQALALCAEDQLIHAAVHLALSDRFVRGVKDLIDIDLLARREAGFDWGRVAAAADDARLGRALHYALHLARRLFGTPVDPVVWGRLRGRRLPLPEDRLLKATAYHYVTALPEAEEFFGMATAKWLATVLLSEARAMRRLSRIARRVLGGERDDPLQTAA